MHPKSLGHLASQFLMTFQLSFEQLPSKHDQKAQRRLIQNAIQAHLQRNRDTDPHSCIFLELSNRYWRNGALRTTLVSRKKGYSQEYVLVTLTSLTSHTSN